MNMLSKHINLEVFKILSAANPWWTDPAAGPAVPSDVKRSEFTSLYAQAKDLESRRAQLLIGPRQVGKSTLLKQIVNELLQEKDPHQKVPPQHVTYIDLEDFARQMPAQPVTLSDIIESIQQNSKPSAQSTIPQFFMFDEIHASVEWALHIKKLVDTHGAKMKILATDSSAAILRKEAVETGAGRWNTQEIEPWSFGDYERLRFAPNTGAMAETESFATLERYFFHGGFPEHVQKENSAEIWKSLREDIEDKAIEKDLARILKVRREPALKALFVAIVRESGVIFDASARSRDLGVSRQKITRWVEQLEDLGLIQILPRWAKSSRKSTRAHPKIYAIDPALVAAFSHEVDPKNNVTVRSKAAETAFLRHARILTRQLEGRLSFYRVERESEADFVLDHKGGRIVFEITTSHEATKDKKRKISEVAGNLGTSMAVIISMTPSERSHTVGKYSILEVPFPLFLREASQLDITPEMARWLKL